MKIHLARLLMLFTALLPTLPGTAWSETNPYVPKLKAGDSPPTGLGTALDGTAFTTTQFAGKVLVVTFWASWCGPCRKELVMLDGLKNAAKDRVEIVAVNIESRETFRNMRRSLAQLAVTTTNDAAKEHADAYGVRGIPHMVLIGKDGKV